MFQGSFVALVTPFRDGQVDRRDLEALVDHQIERGTQGIVPCGTTGESATLSHDEHELVIGTVVERAAGRVPVLAGTGSNSTDEAIRLTRFAQKAGADGALLITPYYNRPTQHGLVAHFRAVAEATEIPLVLYNVPSRTGVNMLPETVIECSRIPRVVGIKEASGSIDQTVEILRECDLDVLSGDDSLTLPLMAVGARGVISVVANVAPRKMSELVASATRGDYDTARALHLELFPLFKRLFCETNPIPVKAAVAMRGLITEEIRLPLTPLSDRYREDLRRLVTELAD